MIHTKMIPSEIIKGSKVVIIKTPTEFKNFEKTNDRCVIFYSAKNCPSCMNILSFYIRLANKYHSRVAMAYVDVTEVGLDFSTIPVFTAIYKKNEICNFEGADKIKLKQLVKKAILAK